MCCRVCCFVVFRAEDGRRDAHELLEFRRVLFRSMQAQAFHSGLAAVWEIIGEANRYVDAQAPWALKKSDPARMATVLYVLAETIRRIALVIQPFMPGSAAKILDQLAVGPGDERQFGAIDKEIGRAHV